ncbi:aspartate racemase [Chimaeribacter californicus]|uniref:Aspartate racemase n=1 Tax=Chimaeribacter californicus TaxID=2060067 RepID=A0A2N5DW88_9GAMM|nr:amino acid racemase [Chimaeribacter californicus]PLR31445.1 aspartate racemase [Chimaeribacter californicus]
MSQPFLLGVLGGMGPLATVDFMYKLLAATPAADDQQQIPVVAWNVPQIADRQKALAGLGPSPLPQLLQGIHRLNEAGASHIAIPCNTAHHWYGALREASTAPLLHIVEATLEKLQTAPARPEHVGIIATQGTLDAGWFQQGLTRLGITPVLPTADEMQNWFVPGCYAVKRGAPAEGGALLLRQAQALCARGAGALILACTEVPVALQAIGAPALPQTFDPAVALAERCSQLWQAYRQAAFS